MSLQSIPGATGGWCDQNSQRIAIDSSQPANAQLRILIHETIHALGVGYAEYGRARAEVIVDTAAHLASSSVGLAVGGETVAYVAGWGEDGALEAVTASAQTIDQLARRIEDVLAGAEPPVAALSAQSPSRNASSLSGGR